MGKYQDYIKKANLQNKSAEYEIGVAYLTEDGVVRNCNMAFEWFQKAALKGYSPAYKKIDLMFKRGEISSDHINKMLTELQCAADNNDDAAQHYLGYISMRGFCGVTKDYEKALGLFRKSADQNNPNAQYHLGYMLERGRGVNVNEAEAIDWYKKAAAKNHSDAKYRLALKYTSGRVLDKNEAEAAKLYLELAKQGHINAKFNLAIMYQQGIGIDVNLSEAYRLCSEVAKHGDADAQCCLANWYVEGIIVSQNIDEAIKLYISAAEKGDLTAANNLKIVFDKFGHVKAKEWLVKNKKLKQPVDNGPEKYPQRSALDLEKRVALLQQEQTALKKELNDVKQLMRSSTEDIQTQLAQLRESLLSRSERPVTVTQAVNTDALVINSPREKHILNKNENQLFLFMNESAGKQLKM